MNTMNTTLLFISGPEIVIVIVVVVLLFGAKKIPELARGLGKGMQELKKATSSIKQEIESNDSESIMNDVKELKQTASEIKNNLTDNEISKNMKDIKNTFKKKTN